MERSNSFKFMESDEEAAEGSADEVMEDPSSSFLSTSPQWPQSYRKSMDTYSIAASPNFGSIISPGFSFRPGSLYRRKSTLPDFAISEEVGTPLLAQKEDPLSAICLPVSSTDDVKLPEYTEYFEEVLLPCQRCSFLQAVFNGINVMVGVGLLSTPYALNEAGWSGMVLLLFFAMICCYTGVLLRRCLESRPGVLTYPDVGQAAFGKFGRIFISIVLYVELYAYCVEFLILEGDNLSKVLTNVHLDWGWFHMGSHKFFAILIAILILPTVWLQDLSVMSYLSVGGVAATIVVILTVFWVGTFNGVGFHNVASPVVNWTGFPLSIGVFGFCYSGHSVFPNIYSSMKNRNQFNQVLQVSFLLATVFYGGVAVMGYLMFGAKTLSQITLNLPRHLTASKIAVWTTVVNPLTKYALILTPVAMGLEEIIPSKYKGTNDQWALRIMIRTALVVSQVCVAILVPFFGYIMALIGSVLSMLVAVILPCACFLSIYWKRANIPEISICVTIITIGIIAGATGTYFSLSGISKSL